MKNKLLIILILFVLIISFFTCSFASSSSLSFDYHTGETINYTLNDSLTSRPYYLVVNFVSSRYTLLCVIFCDEELVIGTDKRNCYIKGHDKDWPNIEASDYNLKRLYYDMNSTSDINNCLSELSSIDFNSIPYSSSAFCGGTYLDEGHIIHSNFDVYDTDNNLVFQAPQVDKVVIPAIQQVEEIPQVMGQAMKILIPIGLIVFSVGLVIYLMRLVISRVQ